MSRRLAPASRMRCPGAGSRSASASSCCSPRCAFSRAYLTSIQLRLELLEDRGRLMAGGPLGGADDELLERVDPGAHVAEPGVQQPRLLPELGKIGRQEQHGLDGAQRVLLPAGLQQA